MSQYYSRQFMLKLLLSTLFCFVSLAQAERAGPDGFGYVLLDTDERGGPVFSDFDISSTGTRLFFNDAENLFAPNADDGTAGIPLGFLNSGGGFPFYGGIYSTAYVSTNGFITFINDNHADDPTNACLTPLPSSDPNAVIAVLWDDLVTENAPATLSAVYYQAFNSCPVTAGGTDSGSCAVVQWKNIRRFGGTQRFNLYAVLYENGNILTSYGDRYSENGRSSTVGIKNFNNTDALQYNCSTTNSVAEGVSARSTILYTSTSPSLQLDMTVALDNGTDTCGSATSLTVPSGEVVRYCYEVTNTGVLPFTLHSLVDSAAGSLLSGIPFTLTPGASSFVTNVETVTSSQTRNSQWSALTPFGSSAVDNSSPVIVTVDNSTTGNSDNCPADPLKTEPGTCGCGVSDIDSDRDGTADCLDSCAADIGKTQAGVCGCGVADVDSDRDGRFDCQDVCPSDPAKTDSAGVCGCGTADSDLNANSIIDCLTTLDLDEELELLRDEVKKLKRKNKSAAKEIRARLNLVLAQIENNLGGLNIQSEPKFNRFVKGMRRKVRTSARLRGRGFSRKKKRAIRAIIKVQANL